MRRRAALQEQLLGWSQRTRRDLPWRRTRDPWAILVSEVMLQQTQVSRVIPRYEAFMATFPTPEACAEAGSGAVVRLWDGLGYNRRAVNLHRAAVQVTEVHDGRMPDDLDALLALPGVGPYTARAVLAFAFERDHGVVDTNAARFLARAVVGHRLTASQAQTHADRMVPPGEGWAWNQAVLDLGAQICTKRSPSCQMCPLSDGCAWFRGGGPDPAEGTAGASGMQSRFEGSDRQGRGRLVAALRTGPIPTERLADAAGWPGDPERASRIADDLVREDLAEFSDSSLTLRT